MTKGQNIHLNAIALERGAFDFVSDEKIVAIKKTYACHFGGANENGEIVTKDSFDAMFGKMQQTAGGIMPSMNWQHDPNCIIGTWTDLVPNTVGLQVTGYMAKGCWDVQNRILPLLDAGVPLYLSTEGWVPYGSMKFSADGDTYTAERFDLLRISIVDIPADFQQREVVANAIELHRENRRVEASEEVETTEEPKENKSRVYVPKFALI